MDDWEKTLPEKKKKKIFTVTLTWKTLGVYHDLYLPRDTLLLADVFENFWNMYLKKYELDPGHLISAIRLAWQATLKRPK